MKLALCGGLCAAVLTLSMSPAMAKCYNAPGYIPRCADAHVVRDTDDKDRVVGQSTRSDSYSASTAPSGSNPPDHRDDHVKAAGDVPSGPRDAHVSGGKS